jgi:hypothetical protein
MYGLSCGMMIASYLPSNCDSIVLQLFIITLGYEPNASSGFVMLMKLHDTRLSGGAIQLVVNEHSMAL